MITNTVEPLNNGHGGDEHFVHCLEVVPSSEVHVELYGGKQFVHCIYIYIYIGRLSSYWSVHYRRFNCTLNSETQTKLYYFKNGSIRML